MANVTSEFVWKWKRLQQRNGQRDIDRDRGREREEEKSVKQLQRSECELNSKFGAIWCV